MGASLIPISSKSIDKLVQKNRFFSFDVIPVGTYDKIPETATISVGAQWVIGTFVDKDLVYQITKTLWNRASRIILDNGHPKGKTITLRNALDGVAIPLHPGAERYSRHLKNRS